MGSRTALLAKAVTIFRELSPPSLKNLMYCFIGVFAGTMIGVLPGIGPLATIAMLLPITFNLEPTSALAQSWLGAAHGGVQLTLYALILMAVILWQPAGLLGVLTVAYGRIAGAIHGGGRAATADNSARGAPR